MWYRFAVGGEHLRKTNFEHLDRMLTPIQFTRLAACAKATTGLYWANHFAQIIHCDYEAKTSNL